MSTAAQPVPALALMHPVAQALPGPPLGMDVRRRRPVGRIGGLMAAVDPAVLSTLGAALGQGAQVLSRAGDLVADWDCCWDGGEQVAALPQWRALIAEGRLAEVEGAFALAWLSPDGALTLARDALGERTLYYALLPTGVVFASTIRALLATGLVSRELEPVSVAAYLSCAYLPGRETLIRSVCEVLPGEVIRFHRGALTSDRFWSVPTEPETWPAEETLRQSLRDRLEEAVRRRLPEGEAVGAFLSGGLDSSLVVALARKLHDARIMTYSVSFGAGYANELSFSSLVAEHCGTEHRIVELSPGVVLHHLDDAIVMLSDPIGDPLTVPNALLFREAAQDVGVVLNGEGGDPCFGGPKNLPMLLAELYDNDVGARERSFLRAHLKCYDDLGAMLAPEVRAALAATPLEARLAPHFDDERWRGFVTKLQAINVTFKGGHHILPKVDALSAPFGVLPRSPLFDRAVVELAFCTPPQLKLHGSVEKYLLKEAVRDLLPGEIVDRPKSGMLVPVEAWFQGSLLPLALERILDGLAPWRLFRLDYLERLLEGRLGGLRPRHGAKIWLLLTLEAWLRTVCLGEPGA
jgi:asparagine synthase (glutamine-hydrolysing)